MFFTFSVYNFFFSLLSMSMITIYFYMVCQFINQFVINSYKFVLFRQLYVYQVMLQLHVCSYQLQHFNLIVSCLVYSSQSLQNQWDFSFCHHCGNKSNFKSCDCKKDIIESKYIFISINLEITLMQQKIIIGENENMKKEGFVTPVFSFSTFRVQSVYF